MAISADTDSCRAVVLRKIRMGRSGYARLILGDSPNNLFVFLGSNGLMHFDGTDWNADLYDGLYVRGGWSGESILFTGGHGRIYHKPVPQGNPQQ